MNGMIATGGGELARLDYLSAEARICAESLANNMLRLGRVFLEAKTLVKHGEWQTWVHDNAGMSVRQAQNLMASYERFGGNPVYDGIDKSKLFKMLALPEGTEERFLEENNVSEMTAREVDAAVKRVREEVRGELENERRLRQEAEQRALEAESRPPELPAEVAADLSEKQETIARQQAELERLAETGRLSIEEANRLRKENDGLRRENVDQAELLQDAQQEYNRLQGDYLNLQSSVAKGDAERIPTDTLTADTFASAVRQFIGICARMPHMSHSFAIMPQSEKTIFDELLQTVESWATASRKAIDTYSAEEAFIYD